jgi:branched-chain amino acid transport system substrate-binding protein
VKKLIGLCVSLLMSCSVWSDNKVLRLYHDADWSNYTESSESILRGVEVALSEINHTVQGYRIEVIKKNHGGNVMRSLGNSEGFVTDPQALAVISGMHSQPLIKNRRFINENKVLTLVPWAAGGPVTRYPSAKNWVFRLSVDDTKAGKVLVDYALDNKGCKAPHMLLADNPWGDSNLASMGKALRSRGKDAASVTRFSWGLKRHSASSKVADIISGGADCILLVANVIEGVELVKAVAALDVKQRLPIISHWGITGGDFHYLVNAEERNKIDLTFIQTCFSFMDEPLSIKGEEVLRKAMKQYPNAIKTSQDIRSPVGFIHGYDLTKLFIAALDQVELGADMLQNRDRLRLALENIQQPVEGLVKIYQKPYSVFGDNNIDAHEALGVDSYCMAAYDDQDNIIVFH